MSKLLRSAAIWALVALVLAPTANAQVFVPPFQLGYATPPTGWFNCDSPGVIADPSRGLFLLKNQIAGVTTGVAGVYNYFGCFADSVDVGGRTMLFAGPNGSIQTLDADGNPFSADMDYHMGSPVGAGGSWCYDNLVIDTAQSTWTGGNITVEFAGSTGRYNYIEGNQGSIHVFQRTDLFGDAVRVAWQFENTDTAPHTVGLFSGRWMAMKTKKNETAGYDEGPLSVGPPTTEKDIYVVSPGIRPPTTERRFIRSADAATFPTFINFEFGKNLADGIQILNGPLKEQDGYDLDVRLLSGDITQGETLADEFVLGTANLLLGLHNTTAAAPFPDQTFPIDPITGSSDFKFGQDAAYIQKFYERSVAPGANRVILQYFRTTWSVSDYRKPYVVTIDPPHLLAYDPNNANGQISPNPMTFRVYIDNTFVLAGRPGQDAGVPISGLVTLKMPKSTGLTFGPNQNATEDVETINGQTIAVETCTKGFNNLEPAHLDNLFQTQDLNGMTFLEFTVLTDGQQTGNLPYYVTVTATPGGTKNLTGMVYASATPRLELRSSANLVSVPWVFNDNSWPNVLNLQPADFSVFVWDPIQMGYVVSASQVRGRGEWVITNADFGVHPLGASATQPADLSTGEGTIQLHSGWNLIGNPYNFPIQLAAFTGISAANTGGGTFTWQQLVSQGVVSGSIAFWDPDTQTYQYDGGNLALLQPNKGYWIFVFTAQDLTLKFPPVFTEFSPSNDPPARALATSWNKSTNRWRLQLAARTNKSVDDQNYIGIVPTSSDANALQALKPPMSPTQNVALSVDQTLKGKVYKMAQAYNVGSGSQKWNAYVQSTDGGSVTLTWPNITSASTNTRFRITDVATNVSRDMRQTSGYTFTADKNSTRQFTIEATPGGASRAIIGAVTVTQPSRAPGAAFSITYALSGPATTTIRILSSTGREVYTVTAGRADTAGQNVVTWALRDNANRAVAPGTYRVEITAETSTGDRVRKVVPVNVIR